jgi:hypothetical protein
LGSGDDEQGIAAFLEVPAGSQVGTYVATLMVAFVRTVVQPTPREETTSPSEQR